MLVSESELGTWSFAQWVSFARTIRDTLPAWKSGTVPTQLERLWEAARALVSFWERPGIPGPIEVLILRDEATQDTLKRLIADLIKELRAIKAVAEKELGNSRDPGDQALADTITNWLNKAPSDK